MFAHYPLRFEYYEDDIENGKIHDMPDLTQNVEKDILADSRAFLSPAVALLTKACNSLFVFLFINFTSST